MDIEQGSVVMGSVMGVDSDGRGEDIMGQQQQCLLARTHMVVFGLVFLFLIFGMLPPSFVMWFFLAVLVMMMWQRWRSNDDPDADPYHRQLLLNQQLLLYASGGQMDLVNLRLALLDRDFNNEDYDLLLALDQQSTPLRPVSDEHISRLPLHKIKIVEGGDLALTPNYSQKNLLLQKQQQQQQCYCRGTCSICLECYGDKDQVMTMPCGHNYHPCCIVPWIKLKGEGAPCPVCKRPIFSPRQLLQQQQIQQQQQQRQQQNTQQSETECEIIVESPEQLV